MKLINFLIALSAVFLFSACGKQPQPIAMNEYNPNVQEPVSSVSVEITQDMIDDMKRRGVIKK